MDSNDEQKIVMGPTLKVDGTISGSAISGSCAKIGTSVAIGSNTVAGALGIYKTIGNRFIDISDGSPGSDEIFFIDNNAHFGIGDLDNIADGNYIKTQNTCIDFYTNNCLGARFRNPGGTLLGSVVDHHQTLGTNTTLGGGNNNKGTSNDSFIGAGTLNTSSAPYSFIGAGESNTISSGETHTFIGSGCRNLLDGDYSSIVGGMLNTSSDACTFIGGGCCNIICSGATNSSIAGGELNQIRTNAKISFIGGGCLNYINSATASIVGGISNTIGTGAEGSVILGGYANTVGNNHCYSVVMGGYNINTTAANQTIVCDLCVKGTISKNGGSFKIDHPTPSKRATHNLIHSFVESPTAGDNIYRYSVITVDNKAEIILPDYYKDLNKDSQIWITADGHFGQAFGLINLETTKLTVTSNQDGKYNVLLIGTRKDEDANKYWKGVETLKNEHEIANYNKKA